MDDLMRDLASGAAAGFAATLPMSAVMQAGHRQLAPGQRQSLPPAQITGKVLQAVGSDEISPKQQTALTLANHFAYGTATGAVYGALLGRSEFPVTAGVAYGLGVWAGSYLIILPAAGLHRSALREPPARNLLMLAAHIVWGASLGAMVNRIRRPHRRGV